MSLFEIQEDFSENYPERYLQGDYLKDEAKFINKVAKLVEALRTTAPATRVQYDLEFLPQEDGVYLYPEALRDHLLTRKLDQVTVSIVKEADSPSTTTVQLHDDEDGDIYISRDSAARDLTSYDSIITKDGAVTDIERIPDSEVLALLLSIAGRQYDGVAALESTIDPPLIAGIEQLDALERNGITSSVWFEYHLPSNRTIRFNVDRSIQERLNSFSITYEVGDAPWAMVATVNREDRLTIDFKKRESDGTSTILAPQGGDYIRLIEIISAEIRLLKSANKTEALSKKALSIAAASDPLQNNDELN